MEVISTVAEWNGVLMPGYDFSAVAIPFGETHAVRGNDVEADSLLVPSSSGQVCFAVTSRCGDDLLAWAGFGADDDHVRCVDVCVREDLRRRGIASALYRLAARVFDAPVVPSGNQVESSTAFWNGRSELI